jgi:predicted CopG family antitoxin
MAENNKTVKLSDEVYEALTWWKELFDDPSYSTTVGRLMGLACHGGVQAVIEKKKETRESYRQEKDFVL